MRAILACLLLLASSVAWAHDFYTGAKNGIGESCCGMNDCFPIPNEEVRLTPRGYAVLFNGAFVDVPRSHVLHSPDGRFHKCVWGGEVKCFYAPPMGS
jgi:hypothetical protein